MDSTKSLDGYTTQVPSDPDVWPQNARIASLEDLNNICNYLINSPGYKLSERRYVNSWRAYFLNRKTLRHFIKEQKIIMTDDPIPDGIALFNTHGYWHRSDVLQVVYLDSVSKSSIQDLVFFLTNLGNSLIKSLGSPPYVLQLLACHSEQLSSVMKTFNTAISFICQKALTVRPET